MKKIIFGLALVLSLGLLASCNNVYQVQDVNATVDSTIYGDVTGTVKYVVTHTTKIGAAAEVKNVTTETYKLSDETFGNTNLYISENPNSNKVDYSFNNVYYNEKTTQVNDAEPSIDKNGGSLRAIVFAKIGEKFYMNGTNPDEVTFTETDTGYKLSGTKKEIDDNSSDNYVNVITYETIYDITFTTKQ